MLAYRCILSIRTYLYGITLLCYLGSPAPCTQAQNLASLSLEMWDGFGKYYPRTQLNKEAIAVPPIIQLGIMRDLFVRKNKRKQQDNAGSSKAQNTVDRLAYLRDYHVQILRISLITPDKTRSVKSFTNLGNQPIIEMHKEFPNIAHNTEIIIEITRLERVDASGNRDVVVLSKQQRQLVFKSK